MDLAEKLANVDMTADNRISEEDRKYGETHQKAYETALSDLKGLVLYCNSMDAAQDEILGDCDRAGRVSRGYTNIKDFSVDSIKKAIYAIHRRFVVFIVDYFNWIYSVELKIDDIADSLIPKKPEYVYDEDENYEIQCREWEITMENLSLRFNDVLDQILIRLDGRTFAELALDEIIEKSTSNSVIRDTRCFEVKGDTICFKDYFCNYTYWFSSDNWELRERMRYILPALWHYETGLFYNYDYPITKIFGHFNWPELEFDGKNKLKSLKCFKNGRVDVKFTSKQNASEFAQKYLGSVDGGGIAE